MTNDELRMEKPSELVTRYSSLVTRNEESSFSSADGLMQKI